MRNLPAVLIAAHAAVIAFACHEITAPKRTAPSAVAPATSATPLDAMSLAELEVLAQLEDSLIGAIQDDAGDVAAMAELAHLYMLHGAYDEAVGPLARALEIAPERDDLRSELRLAFRLGKLDEQQVDLAEKVRQFLDLVSMTGHGC